MGWDADSSNANKSGPRHTFSILARACCKHTDKILGRLVSEAFEVSNAALYYALSYVLRSVILILMLMSHPVITC
jgi:hypothetical protein